MQDLFSPSKWTATQKLTVSFLVVILTGSFLLWLPISNQPGTHQTYLDHLFTAVSMVCVTGLTVLSIKDTYT
ncbi:MAG: TrkH family potassium uptake protein, partial [Abiotrophia defectiva]|nr:TrkH family potassium uptake protein [Abiotrophia defectiva]